MNNLQPYVAPKSIATNALQPYIVPKHYNVLSRINSKQQDDIKYPDRKIMESLVISRTISFSKYTDIPVCNIERPKTFEMINKYKRCMLFVELNEADRAHEPEAVVTVIFYNFKQNRPTMVPLKKEELDNEIFRYFLKKKVMLISGNQERNNSTPIYFYPRIPNPKAYMIGGHGGEQSESFIVPDNCMVVVRVLHSAVQDLHTLTDYVRKICNMDKNILKDPYGNLSSIIDQFGSLVIYGPGDTCPNFVYNLLMCWKTLDGRYGFCSKTGSGIIDMDRLDENNEVCKLEPWSVEQRTELDMKLTQLRVAHESYFTSLFSNSIYPTSDDILQKISYQKIFDDIYNTYTVTQQQLCSMPGIYYNFVCRGTDNTNAIEQLQNHIDYLAPKNSDNKLKASLLEKRTKLEQIEKSNLPNKEKKKLSNTIRNLGNSNLQQRARSVLFSRISETEKRKELIRKKYQNGGRRKTRKRSKQTQRKDN